MTDTPNRQPLSPAAQAVLDAYGNEVGGSAAITSYERRGITAALRAAVGQVRTDPNLKRQIARREAEMLTLNKVLAIATELEDAND